MTKSMQLTYGTRFLGGVQVLTSSGSFRAWDMKVWTSSWRAMMTNLPMPSFLIFECLACWNWHPIFESRVVCTQKMPWNQTKNLPQLMLRFSVAPPSLPKNGNSSSSTNHHHNFNLNFNNFNFPYSHSIPPSRDLLRATSKVPLHSLCRAWERGSRLRWPHGGQDRWGSACLESCNVRFGEFLLMIWCIDMAVSSIVSP